MPTVGAIYNSFYDCDLLEYSVKSISPVVDYVVVVHQEVSFTGHFAPPNSLKTLEELGSRGVIDELIVINPDIYPSNKLDAMIQKRNLGLYAIKKQGLDYVMPMDADEFYDSGELDAHIKLIDGTARNTSYSIIHAYYGNERNVFIDTYSVPSIYKVDDRIFKRTASSVLSDPARKMKEELGSVCFAPNMHHLTYMPNRYGIKRAGVRNTHLSDMYNKVYQRLQNWKQGDNALVFTNDTVTGENKLKEVELHTDDSGFFKNLEIPEKLLR